MTMTATIQGQIALRYVKNMMRKEGVRLGPHTAREIGNFAKELAIPTEVATEFVEIIACELMQEAFGKKVTLGEKVGGGH